MYFIYKITNIINNKCYIGFTKNPNKRKQQHLSGRSISCYKLHRAIKKYGKEAFSFELIYENMDRIHTLTIQEPFYIQKYDSIKNGYNVSNGGFNINTPEIIEKTRIRMTNNNPMKNPQTRQKVSQSLIGKSWGNHTNISKEKLSIAKTGINNPNYKNPNASKHLHTKNYKCEYCDIITTKGNYVRWHGSNCKKHPSIVTFRRKTL
jgi:group I intron endonuclease